MNVTEKQYTGTPGAKTIFDFELGGKHVFGVRRSGMTYKKTAAVNPGNMEFKHSGVSIRFENPFEGTLTETSVGVVTMVGEKVWVLFGD